MKNNYHTFHIPVMGTGHSVDTPIRVAPFGITSVISLVDDRLLEKIRKYYAGKYGMPYSTLPKHETDGRAKRITAYLETVKQIVDYKMDTIKRQPFFADNDKQKYFDLLPEDIPLKKEYNTLLKMKAGEERDALAEELTHKMRAGSIDVNIMVKLDNANVDGDGIALDDEFSDAKAALRGYADSSLCSGIVFSAGINKNLFSYMTRFRDFYRDKTGKIKKKIILKVSDFRSARLQGKFLAAKGLEVHEFRIESGLNCGGHAFPSNGNLLPYLLQEFKENRELLTSECTPLVQKHYHKMGWHFPGSTVLCRPLLTVQGGLGNYGEDQRLREGFGMDLTGWGSPFLLVPEATCVDQATRNLLESAEEKDLYVSNISPLQIPFNHVRRTPSEIWTQNMADAGRPGSPCPKQFLLSNTEFTERPVCLASRKYQEKKLQEINRMEVSGVEKERLRKKVVAKTCICGHLGNGALVALGLANEKNAPPLVCPGPNIAWFKKSYTLKEMVDHIYGRGSSLVPSHRPHMFAKEIVMYVDHYEKLATHGSHTPRQLKSLDAFRKNLEAGMDLCLAIAKKQPFQGENLASILPCVMRQRTRLHDIHRKITTKKFSTSGKSTEGFPSDTPKQSEKAATGFSLKSA